MSSFQRLRFLPKWHKVQYAKIDKNLKKRQRLKGCVHGYWKFPGAANNYCGPSGIEDGCEWLTFVLPVDENVLC
jgi:hypothetical protein